MPLLGINCLDSFLNFRNRKKPKSSKQKIPAFFIWTKLSLFLLSISHSSRFPFLLTPIPPLLPIFPSFTPPHPIFSHAPFSLFQYTPFFPSFTPTPPTPPYFLLPFSPTPLTSSHSSLSFAPPHPIFSHAPFSLFQYTPFFLPFTPTHPTPPHFFTFLFSNTSTSSHPSLSFAPTHPIFSHIPFSLFQYAPFLHIPFSYIPTPPPFPIPSHVFFSSKSNHVHSPKIPLLQNPKPENPLVLSQCSTPFAEPSSSFPLQNK